MREENIKKRRITAENSSNKQQRQLMQDVGSETKSQANTTMQDISNVAVVSPDTLELVISKDAEAIIKHLNTLQQSGKLNEISRQLDKRSNNFLHLAILNHEVIGIDNFKKIIDILGGTLLIDLHHFTNDDGYAPFELVAELPPTKIKTQLVSLLLSSALESTEKYLEDSTSPDDEKISQNDPELAANLNLARAAIDHNHPIINIKRSTTHPLTNRLSDAEFKDLCSERLALAKKLFKSGNRLCSQHISDIKEAGVGDCRDFAFLTESYLASQSSFYQNMLFGFEVGKSKYYAAALNLSDTAIRENPSTWGTNAVFVVMIPSAGESIICFHRTDSNGVSTCYSLIGKDIKSSDIDEIDAWDDQTRLIENGKAKKCTNPIESMRYLNGDHHFNVLGRNLEQSDINNTSTYGPKAVVIDGWRKIYFPAKDADKKLKDHYAVVVNGRCYNFIKSFNKKYHQLTSEVRIGKDSLREYFDPDSVKGGVSKKISPLREEKDSAADNLSGKKSEVKDSAVKDSAADNFSVKKMGVETDKKYAARAEQPTLTLPYAKFERLTDLGSLYSMVHSVMLFQSTLPQQQRVETQTAAPSLSSLFFKANSKMPQSTLPQQQRVETQTTVSSSSQHCILC